jgi:hypothetical protein
MNAALPYFGLPDWTPAFAGEGNSLVAATLFSKTLLPKSVQDIS